MATIVKPVLSPLEWASAIAIGLATGVGLTEEAKIELRQACQSATFKVDFVQALKDLEVFHLIFPESSQIELKKGWIEVPTS